MPSVDAYDASLTSIEFAWPSGITPVERIMLSAHGDLQRLLSAFFARPISINLIFAQTHPSLLKEALHPTPTSPTTQKRQVHLTCSGRVACVATSSVVISSPLYAKLFLEEGYAIGQVFRKTGDVPVFDLLEAGLIGDLGEEEEMEKRPRKAQTLLKREPERMWRRYRLKVDGFEADIVEVFPDRSMFTHCEDWLNEPQQLAVPSGHDASAPWTPSLSPTDTLVSSEERWDQATRAVSTPPVNTRDTAWLDSTGGLLRFIAVFIAVLLLLSVPREEGDLSSPAGALIARISRLLNVHQADS